MLKKILAFTILVNVFSFGYSQIDFTRVTKTIGSNLEVADIGDLNNDGLNDIVVASGYYSDASNDYHLFIFYQNPDGTLNNPVKIKYPGFYPGLKVLHISDVNHDDLKDIIIGYTDSIGIYYQNSSGGLEPVRTFFSGQDVDGLKTGDLNNDGLNDIAVSHWNDNFIKVFYQNQAGTFNTVNYAAEASGRDEIDISDVNNDGLADIIRMPGQLSTGSLQIYFQDKNAGITDSFQTFEYSFDYRKNFNGIGTGDLNNDHKNDIVGAIGGNTAAIVLLMQDSSDNVFSNPIRLQAYDIPTPVEIYDLNCDDNNEIVVGHHGWDAVTVYQKNASGIYKDYLRFQASYYFNPNSMAIGDVNNDHKPDIVTVNYTDAEILYNTSKPDRFSSVDTSILNPDVKIDTLRDYHNYEITRVDSSTDCHVKNIYFCEVYSKMRYERHTGDSAFFRSGSICSKEYADTVMKGFDYTLETRISADTNMYLVSTDTVVYNGHFTEYFTRGDTLDMWTEMGTARLRLEDITVSHDTVIIHVDSVQVSNRTLFVQMDYLYYAILEGQRCKMLYIDTVLTYRNQGIVSRMIGTDTLLLSQTVERYPSFTTSVTGHSEKDFILYPNPFHDHLTVEVPHTEAKSGELLILDLSGKVEFRKKIDAPGKWDIDLSGLTPGTYIIEIGTGDKKFAGKIVKN